MAVLSLAVALQIAGQCALDAKPETLLPIIATESAFDPLAIKDNIDGRSYSPASVDAAERLASQLIALHHNLDLGAAQINWASGHLQHRNLPLRAAFDQCTSFRVGSQVLAECWDRAVGATEQLRLRNAVGCYNTGSPNRGAAYAARVWQAAKRIVPAIQLAGSNQEPATPEDVRTPEPRRAPPGLEDALHAGPASSDADDDIADALHHPTAPKEDQ